MAPRPDRLTVLYDGDCGLCSMAARMLIVLDGGRRLDVTPLRRFVATSAADPDPSRLVDALHIRDAEGAWATGGDAVLRTMAAIPILVPLAVIGRLPVLRPAVDWLYRRVAANRDVIGTWLGVDRCRIPTRRSVAAPRRRSERRREKGGRPGRPSRCRARPGP